MSLLEKRISVRTLVLSMLAVGLLALLANQSHAVTPGILSYQGRVLVNNAPFTGTGQFMFALVDTTGATTYWSNDNTSTGGSQPNSAVSLAVTNGLYSVMLGDINNANNMTNAIPSSVFNNNSDVRLRIWFNDNQGNGSKLLSPDQRIAPVGYAMTAAAVDSGAITTGMIAQGAVTLPKLATLPKANVSSTVNQPIPSNILTTLSFNNTRYDTDNIHPTAGSKLTCMTAGVYHLCGNVFWDESPGGTYFVLRIVLNGSTVIAQQLIPRTGVNTTINVAIDYQLAIGDYAEMQVIQDSGSTVNVDACTSGEQDAASFAMHLVP